MSTPTILCVDDEKLILITLKNQLRSRFGDRYYYDVAQSAREAWEVLEDLADQGPVQCVLICDYIMPVTYGDEFLIQVHDRFPEIIKVMLTGQIDAKTLQELKGKIPLHRYIRKPWTEDQLVEAIESGMDIIMKKSKFMTKNGNHRFGNSGFLPRFYLRDGCRKPAGFTGL